MVNPAFDISDEVFNTGVELDAELITPSGSVSCKIHLSSDPILIERGGGYAMAGTEETVVIKTAVYEAAGSPKQINIANVSYEVQGTPENDGYGITILSLK